MLVAVVAVSQPVTVPNIMGEKDGLKVLQQWAQQKRLLDAQMSEDGNSLTLDGKSLDAKQAYHVALDAKTCHYTLASIFLQILDPNQGLMVYRGACKKYSVTDPVKALDKPVIVGFFLEGGEEAGEQEEAPTATSTIAQELPSEGRPKKKPREEDHRRKSSSKDDRKRKDRDKGRDRDRKEEKKRDKDYLKEKKKRKGTPMTNAQLFSRLDGVVDKRSDTGKEAEEVQAALSAGGFMVSPEDLKKHKEVNDTIQSMEIPVGSSSSILRAAAASEGRDFTRVLNLYLESIKPVKTDKKGNSPKLQIQQKNSKAHLIGKKPVIILPKGMQPPITMVNAYEFFANQKFIPRDVQLKKGGRAAAAASTFSRKVQARLGGGTLEYELMDNPKAKLGDNRKEWDRVVAVVALGASWQFKDWPERFSDPVHLFSRSFGFYVGMQSDPIPSEIKTWNVKICHLNRDKRGLDSVTSASFWNGLDEWMAVHKPEMLPRDDGA